jgi:hypothetical protein
LNFYSIFSKFILTTAANRVIPAKTILIKDK